jgi:hypothetical protein
VTAGCRVARWGAQQKSLFEGVARAGHILLKADHFFAGSEFCSTLPSLLLGIVDHVRRRFTRFDLRTHLLQARSKRFNSLLLLCDSRLKVLLLLRETCLQRLNSPMVRRRWIVT